MGVSVNQPGLQVILQVGVVVVIMLFGVTRGLLFKLDLLNLFCLYSTILLEP